MRTLVVTALLVYACSLLGAAVAPRDVAETPQTPAVAPAPPPGELRQMIGFAVNLHHTDDLSLYLTAIDQLHALGFNSLEVLTPAFQDHGAAQEIQIDVAPGRSPRREDLLELLQHARRKDMRVALMPTVLFREPRGNEWRGKISPERWDPWWRSYQGVIDYFLDIAVEADVQVFSVGSELLSTEKQSERWEKLIAHVRQRFPGRLMYSTNWDHYHVPAYWQHLDLIGISSYWDITSAAAASGAPTDEELAQRWRQIRQQLLAYAGAQGRPILFTEVGYPSLSWGLKDPWNYITGPDIVADPATQARGYRAFLTAWDDLLRPDHAIAADDGALAGVFFYKWDVYHNGGAEDTGYGVRGKPALDLLREWLMSRSAAE